MFTVELTTEELFALVIFLAEHETPDSLKTLETILQAKLLRLAKEQK